MRVADIFASESAADSYNTTLSVNSQHSSELRPNPYEGSNNSFYFVFPDSWCRTANMLLDCQRTAGPQGITLRFLKQAGPPILGNWGMTTPVIAGFSAVSSVPAIDSIYGAGDRLIIDL